MGIETIYSNLSNIIISAAALIGAFIVVAKPIKACLKRIEPKVSGAQRDEKIIQRIDQLQVKINTRINEIAQKNDTNEKDRLKDEIFRYGNIARQGRNISSEQFRNFQRNFEKYTTLGGNDIAHDEYNFVVNYYNNSFLKARDAQ